MDNSYTVPHHLAKLHDELLDAGMPTTVVVRGDGETLRLTGNYDEAAVQSVLDAHDPTPPDDPDPDDELDAGLAEVEARDDVPDWGRALLSQLRGQGGQQGRAAGRRPNR